MGSLFGYWGTPPGGEDAQEALLAAMAEKLAHRAPAGWERGFSRFRPDHMVALGHGRTRRTLAPQLATAGGHGSACAWSGVFFSRHDAHSLLRAPRPDALLTHLKGAFVAAWADASGLHLFRDHGGLRTLYWTRTGNRLLFASEVRALFADASCRKQLRTGALPEYFTFSFIPGENTMFEGIFELQPGHTLHFDGTTVTVRRLFCFEELEWQPGGWDEETAILKVRAALEASVDACLAASSRTPAVYLSGGIDSSAVMAVACRRLGRPLPSFSLHFGKKYVNENIFVEEMVARYRNAHTWVEVKPKGFLTRLQEIVSRLDEPIGDPVTVPNFLMAEQVSKVADVALNGEGGDPLFGGPKNIPMILARIYGPPPGVPREHWLERAYLASYRRAHDDLESLLTPDVYRGEESQDALIALLTPFFTSPRPRHFLNRLMSINIRMKGANLILVKVEKMAAANGLLPLAPLFSKDMIEASLRCPPESKLKDTVEKWVLKEAVRPWVPASIIARPKSGMRVPVRYWFQGEMKRFTRSLLTPKRLSRLGMFHVETVRQLMDYDAEGVLGFRNGMKLWMMMTLVLWCEENGLGG